MRTASVSTFSRVLAALPPWLLCLGAGVYLMARHLPPPVLEKTVERPAEPAPLAGTPLTVTALAPDAGARVRFPQSAYGAEIEFRWSSTVTGAAPEGTTHRAMLVLDISRDPSFAESVTSSRRLTVPDNASLSVLLSPDHYYWRLHLEGQAATETRELWVEQE